MIGSGHTSRRRWRPLLSVLVAYALAAQTLLIAFAAMAPLQATDNGPAFVLCHQDSDVSPQLPAGKPNPTSCAHCIFCFAGSHHSLIGAPPAVHRPAIVAVRQAFAAVARTRPDETRYGIASPRGPPLQA